MIIHRPCTDAFRFYRPARERHLPKGQYAAFLILGLSLAAGQLIALPHWLTARDFGSTLIAISATQIAIQLGDFGIPYINVSILRDDEARVKRREAALSLSCVVLGCGILLLLLAAPRIPDDLGPILAVALLTAVVLEPAKLRASAYEAAGDEVWASIHNFIWQNSPKFGMLLAALLWHSALAVVAGGFASAALVALPVPPARSARPLLLVRRTWSEWGPGAGSILSILTFTWTDTYVLAATLGLAAAAGYQAGYRVIAGVTYIFIPLGSMLIARLNAHNVPAARRVLVAAIGVSGFVTGVTALGLWRGDQILFPNLTIPGLALIPLAVGFTASSASYMFGQALVVYGRVTAVLKINMGVGVVSLALYLSLIPIFGIVAAASVFSSCAVAAAVCQGALLHVIGTRRMEPQANVAPA